MAARQILIPAAAFPRVADRLAALSDETGEAIEVLAWSEDGVVDADGQPVSDPQPEVAWTAIDLFFVGQFATFVDAALETGTVKWVQGCLAGTDAPPFARILQSGARLSPSDAPNAGVAEYVMAAVMGVS